MSMGNGEPNKPDMESGPPSLEKETKKATKKIIRVLTVMAYLFSVSMAAIMLSLYYIFLWNPTSPSSNAQTMPEEMYHYDTEVPPVFPDRMVNRTWEAPEEPRALPVKLNDPPQQMTDEMARLHSNEPADDWDNQQAYQILRKRRRTARDVYELLKNRSVAKTLGLGST